MITVLLLLAQIAGTAQNQTGSVKGVVVDSVSHQPIKKATVTLNHIQGPGGSQAEYQGPSSVITDDTGSFVFEKVPSGHAQIVVTHRSYPPLRSFKVVDINPGETAGSVTVELNPGAAIGGHVVDEDGDPLNACMVHPHPAAHVDQFVQEQGRPNTNGDGEYRIFGLEPGKYIVSVDCQQPVFQPRPFSSGPDLPPSRAYAPEYYPSAADSKSAEVIDLAPGAEKSGVDFQMKSEAVTQIHGTFGGDLWRGHQNLQFILINTNTTAANRMGAGAAADTSKGTFEFRRVFPGSYMLVGFTYDGDVENRIGLVQRVEVKDQPVQLVAEWRRAMEVEGTVELENHNAQTVSLNQLSIQLVPGDSMANGQMAHTTVNDDGTFILKGVLPGTWRVQLLGPRLFLKSAWLGTEEITDQPIDLTGGVAGQLRLVVSTNTATIQGTAPVGKNVTTQRAEGGTWSVQVDPNGKYVLAGLAPGKYRLTTTEVFTPMPDDQGTEVTVAEGETVTVDLKN